MASVLVEGATISDVWIHILFQVLLDQPVQVITVLFQVRLPLLEEHLARLRHPLVKIVAISVGPLENLSALDDCVAALLQKVEFLGRIALSLVEENAFLLNHRQKFDRKLSRAIVVGISLIVPHVTL